MIRLLFVDDDVTSLAELRSRLAHLEGEWEMQFATSGADALELLEDDLVDVVVAAEQMSELDGFGLFEAIRESRPGVVRLMLCSTSGQAAPCFSGRNAHRYLEKDGDVGELELAVTQCTYIRSLLANESLREVVVGLTDLPTLPSLYTEIVKISQDETKTLRDAGAAVAKDVGMTAKILQLVNSALFGIPRQISSVEDAVGFLGIDTLKSLVLSVRLFSSMGAVKLRGRSLEKLAEHNLRTGIFAQQIAMQQGASKEVVDHAFLAGSLHDAGILILASEFAQRYAKAELFAEREGVHVTELEEREFGTSHASLGAYLLSLWGFPDEILEAVLLHHDPASYPGLEFTALTAVHVANAIDQQLSGRGDEPERLDRDYLRALGLEDEIDGWVELCSGLIARDEAA